MFVFVGAYICIGSIFLYYFVAIMFQIFLCTPREKIWNLLLEGGHCFNSDALFQATGMRAVWKLQISIAKKLGVTAIFATGLLYVFPTFPAFASKCLNMFDTCRFWPSRTGPR